MSRSHNDEIKCAINYHLHFQLQTPASASNPIQSVLGKTLLSIVSIVFWSASSILQSHSLWGTRLIDFLWFPHQMCSAYKTMDFSQQDPSAHLGLLRGERHAGFVWFWISPPATKGSPWQIIPSMTCTSFSPPPQNLKLTFRSINGWAVLNCSVSDGQNGTKSNTCRSVELALQS